MCKDKRFDVYRFLPAAGRMSLIGLLDEKALQNIWPDCISHDTRSPFRYDEGQKIVAFEKGHLGLEPYEDKNPLDYEVFVVEIDGNAQWVNDYQNCWDFVVKEADIEPQKPHVIQIRHAKFDEILEQLETMM